MRRGTATRVAPRPARCCAIVVGLVALPLLTVAAEPGPRAASSCPRCCSSTSSSSWSIAAHRRAGRRRRRRRRRLAARQLVLRRPDPHVHDHRGARTSSRSSCSSSSPSRSARSSTSSRVGRARRAGPRCRPKRWLARRRTWPPRPTRCRDARPAAGHVRPRRRAPARPSTTRIEAICRPATSAASRRCALALTGRQTASRPRRAGGLRPAAVGDEQRVLRVVADQLSVAVAHPPPGRASRRGGDPRRRSTWCAPRCCAAVSHDLRTPLASIKAMVSGLRDPDVRLDADAARRCAGHRRGRDRPAQPPGRQPARRQPAADRRARRRRATDAARSTRSRPRSAPSAARRERRRRRSPR